MFRSRLNRSIFGMAVGVGTLFTANVTSSTYALSSSTKTNNNNDIDNNNQGKKLFTISHFQKRLDRLGVGEVINIETNFTYNFITIAGTVLYWGATWNLLNSYFFTKSIPNKKINSLLRIGVGMAILAFPDNDIKEAGGNWYGIDDDEDLDSLNSIDDEELQEHISEAYLIANKGLNWAGDSFDLSRKDINDAFIEANKKKMEKNDNDDDDRRKKEITIGEFLIQLERIQHAKAIEGEEEELNRLQLIENYLNEKGLSLYLDHNYFQNIMLGTGIITAWSGFEGLFNATFFVKTIPNVFLNNMARICLAACILYLPNGNLNIIGDGSLDDDDDDNEMSITFLRNTIVKTMNKKKNNGDDVNNMLISIEECYQLFDEIDTNKDGILSRSNHLVDAIAKNRKKENKIK